MGLRRRLAKLGEAVKARATGLASNRMGWAIFCQSKAVRDICVSQHCVCIGSDNSAEKRPRSLELRGPCDCGPWVISDL